MTIDQMITAADAAATSLRWKAQMTAATSIASRLELKRPRRRRHRLTPIEYRMTQAEFIVSGFAAAVLGGFFSVALAQILFGVWR